MTPRLSFRTPWSLVGACTMLLAVRAPLAAQSSVTATDPWVREAAAGRPTTGMFVKLTNASGTTRKVLFGKADVGDTLELHEMKRDNGMMRMSPVPEIVVPANGEVDLRPGGYHLMLFGLKKALVPGDTVRVTLTLDDGSEVKLVAPVRTMRMP